MLSTRAKVWAWSGAPPERLERIDNTRYVLGDNGQRFIDRFAKKVISLVEHYFKAELRLLLKLEWFW